MAALASKGPTQNSDPDFIKYLFNPTFDYDCYLVVGNPSLAPVEKIGVVKKMLYAHSSVMRSDLQEIDIVKKVTIEVQDIFPGTFRNLLRFVYGFDTTATLSFDDADNLLYAAEKYMMTPLKNKVATRLLELLNYQNICSLMNNPACYQTLELNSRINKILQFETSKVFASPHFLELTDDAFVKLLKQDMLNVIEIEVWRKAVIWAKHQAKSGDGKALRKVMKKILKHVRVCTLKLEDFCKEVVPTKVLLDEEVTGVCLSLGSKVKQPSLTKICNEIEVRKLPIVKSSTKQKVVSNQVHTTNLRESSFTVLTLGLGIEISSLTVSSRANRSVSSALFNFSIDMEKVNTQESDRSSNNQIDFLTFEHYQPQVVRRPADRLGNRVPRFQVEPSSSESKISFAFTASVSDPHNSNDLTFTIPFSTEDREVHLLPDSQYQINIRCNQGIDGYYSGGCNLYGGGSHSEMNDLLIKPGSHPHGFSQGCFPIKKIEYKTLTRPH